MLSDYNYLLAKTEAADADDCYADDQSCCGNNHHDNQHCKEIQQNSVDYIFLMFTYMYDSLLSTLTTLLQCIFWTSIISFHT